MSLTQNTRQTAINASSFRCSFVRLFICSSVNIYSITTVLFDSLLFPPFTGNNQDLSPPNLPVHSITTTKSTGLSGGPGIGNNNLNINLPENNNAILRLEVELRDKNAPKYRRAAGLGVPSAAAAAGRGGATRPAGYNRADGKGIGGAVTNVMTDLKGNAIIPLEKVGKQNVYHLVSRQNVPLYLLPVTRPISTLSPISVPWNDDLSNVFSALPNIYGWKLKCTARVRKSHGETRLLTNSKKSLYECSVVHVDVQEFSRAVPSQSVDVPLGS